MSNIEINYRGMLRKDDEACVIYYLSGRHTILLVPLF